MLNGHVPVLCAIAPPVNIPRRIGIAAEAIECGFETKVDIQSGESHVWGKDCARSCKVDDAEAKQHQDVNMWCIPVSGTAGIEGSPFLAVGCGDQVQILSVLDGNDAMQLICCLEPGGGRVLAVSWSTSGTQLACCSEKAVIVYTAQSVGHKHRNGRGAQTGSKWDVSGIQWTVSHRVAAASQSSVCWAFLGGEAVVVAGGSEWSLWKLPAPKDHDDFFGIEQPEPLIPFGAASSKADGTRVQADQALGVRDVAGVHQLVVSPDSRWCASCPAFGRIVSIREIGSTTGLGKLILLPHSRAVLGMQWRWRLKRGSAPACTVPAFNALLTHCSDDKVRIWKELSKLCDAESCAAPGGVARASEGGTRDRTYVLSYVIGADMHKSVPATEHPISAACWVIDSVPGYETEGAWIPKGVVAAGSAQHEDGNDDEVQHEEVSADDCALVVTVAGSCLTVWAVSGLAYDNQGAVSTSCVLRLDLAQLVGSLPQRLVDVRAFRCAVSPSYSEGGTGDKGRLSLLVTDARGVLTSISTALSSSPSIDSRAAYTGARLTTPHAPPARCVLVSDHTCDLVVVADDKGTMSCWTWDLNPVGQVSRHPLAFAGSLPLPADDPSLVSMFGSSSLILGDTSGQIRLVDLVSPSSADRERGVSRMVVRERLLLPTTCQEQLQMLTSLPVSVQGWVCAVGLTHGNKTRSNLWCGGSHVWRTPGPTERTQSSSPCHVALHAASIDQSIAQYPLTCLHVPGVSHVSRSMCATHSQSDAVACGFFFAGDARGRIHLLCAHFFTEDTINGAADSDRVSGRVDLVSRFGGGKGSAVVLVRAHSLTTVASVHEEDPHRVHIWQAAASHDSFYEADCVTVSGLSDIVSLAWFEPAPLCLYLAVATDTSVHVMSSTTPSSATASSPDKSAVACGWQVQWSSRVSGCSSVRWLADARLLTSSMGGILVFEPALAPDHHGHARIPTSLSNANTCGFSLSIAGRHVLGGPSGSQHVHELLRDGALAGLSLAHPRRAQLFWTAGHREALDGMLTSVSTIVAEEGAASRKLDDSVAVCAQDAAHSARAQQSRVQDTAESIADAGFTPSFFIQSDSAPSDASGAGRTSALCKLLLDNVAQADGQASRVLCDLCTVVRAMHEAMADTSSKLDEPAQRFAFAVMLAKSAGEQVNASTATDESKQMQALSGGDAQGSAREIKAGGVSIADIAWALLSAEQDTLVRKFIADDATWEDLRMLGAPLWISSPSTLKAVAEKLSRAQFKRDKDPTQCALLYLCLDKRTTLTAMFKAVKNDTLYAFFMRDFSQEQHRQAAIKNACVLLSQHRYALAAAFFVLGGHFKDALDTVLNKMNDPMLALFVARLFAKSDAGPVYEEATHLLLAKWRSTNDKVAQGLLLWRLGRFHEALTSLAASASVRGLDSLSLAQLLAVYTQMRVDPRVRLAAVEAKKDYEADVGGLAYSMTGLTPNTSTSMTSPYKMQWDSDDDDDKQQDQDKQGDQDKKQDQEEAAEEEQAAAEGQMDAVGESSQDREDAGEQEYDNGEDTLGEADGVMDGVSTDEMKEEGEEESAPEPSRVLTVADTLRLEVQLRHTLTYSLAAEGAIDLALEQCRLVVDLHQQVDAEQRLYEASQGGESAGSQGAGISATIGAQAAARLFEEQLLVLLRGAVAERAVRMSLPLTLDYVHPTSLQTKDPAKLVAVLNMLNDVLPTAVGAEPTALIGPALQECKALARLDCHTALSLSAGAASEGFELLTSTALTIPHALRSLAITTRSSDAAAYLLRLAQRFTAAGSIMAEACGQPLWLGDCLPLDAKHRRLCLAAFFCTFMGFWHSRDTAGLQLLLGGSWDERASKSTDCAMVMASYVQRALTRASLLHRCSWAKVWARFEKQISTLQERCGIVVDQPYAENGREGGPEEVRTRLLEVLVLARINCLLDMALSFGQTEDDDVCSMLVVASEALRGAKDRAIRALHASAAAGLSIEALADVLQPYLRPVAPVRSDQQQADVMGGTPKGGQCAEGTEGAAAAHLRRVLMLSDDGAQGEIHKVALALLAYQPRAYNTQMSRKVRLGKIEVLLAHKGEVLRSVCARSDDRAAAVLAVCSNKCIREAHCRPDAVSVVGAGHDGLAAALSPSVTPTTPSAQHAGISDLSLSHRSDPNPPSFSREKISSSSLSSLSADDEGGQTTSAMAPSLFSAVDGMLEMLWDKVSTSAAEVVHDLGGTAAPCVGAMALAAHPWLPVFVSGGADGSVLLWGFGAPQPLSSFGTLSGASSAAPLSRLRFDAPGAKFCGCDSSGLAGVWNFELARGGQGQDRRPVDVIQAHTKRCYDVCFMDKGTLMATAGSGAAASVCAWDLLMPPHCACIASIAAHDGTANSVCHMDTKNIIVSGGQRGDLAVIDTRTWRCLRTLPSAHKQAVRALCTSPNGTLLVSGGTDGDIKFWDIADLVGGAGDASCVLTWQSAHEKGTYVGAGGNTPMGTYGVMDVSLTKSHLLSCGADGRLIRRAYSFT